MTIESEAPKSEETTAPVEGQKEQTVDVNELARTVERKLSKRKTH